MAESRIPSWLSGALVLGAFGALVWLEYHRPLRRSVEPKAVHDARDLAMGGLGAATLQVLERPVVEPLAELVQRRRFGMLKLVRLPAWVEVPLAIVLMDYTLYL